MLTNTFSSKQRYAWTILVLLCLLIASRVLVHLLAPSIGQAVNAFDYHIITFLNQFAHRSWTLDTFFFLMDSNRLITGPILVLLWWAWFKKGDDQAQNRELVLFGILSSFLALFCARVLALIMPFRERPLRNPLIHFQLPYYMRAERLLGWSSFPSDHAALWFCLATVIFFVSRRAGIFLYIYISCTLCIARIYLGIHYPTDIIVGALIGIGVASLARLPEIRTALTRRPLAWAGMAPGLFYACFFLMTDQMTEGFGPMIELYQYFHTVAKAIFKLS